MAESRIRNVKRNIMTGLLYRATSILLPFIIRTAILYILGEQYLGLSSLFSSILQVLNLAELGFSSAIVYNMYRPVAEGDAQTVCALLNYYKKACRIIGGVIALGGLLLTPWSTGPGLWRPICTCCISSICSTRRSAIFSSPIRALC